MALSPLISVIVPCYNQAQYMDECLQSVLDQTYTNWECIIVNDGSPDNTEEIALQWTQKDLRFKYLKKENGGLSSARNAGIEVAKGEWILPLDSDDKIGERYLELASEQFSKDFAIIYCDAELFGIKNEFWELPEFSMEEFAIQNIIFCSAFFKKKDWFEVGYYDEQMKKGLEDWEFWIRILSKKKYIYKIPLICFYYRTKNESMASILNEDKEKFNSVLKYIYLKNFTFFLEYLPSFQSIIKEYRSLIIINEKLRNSKRYKIINNLLKIIKR